MHHVHPCFPALTRCVAIHLPHSGGEPAECWTLAYDHCIPGYTSRNRLPRAVVYNEQRVRLCLSVTTVNAEREGSAQLG